MRNARLDEAQAGIKIAGRNINNLSYADDTTKENIQVMSGAVGRGLLRNILHEGHSLSN